MYKIVHEDGKMVAVPSEKRLHSINKSKSVKSPIKQRSRQASSGRQSSGIFRRLNSREYRARRVENLSKQSLKMVSKDSITKLAMNRVNTVMRNDIAKRVISNHEILDARSQL